MAGIAVAFVIGVFSGLAVYLIVAALIRPNLVFEPQVGEITGPRPYTGGSRYRFLHVRVVNRGRPRWQWWR